MSCPLRSLKVLYVCMFVCSSFQMSLGDKVGSWVNRARTHFVTLISGCGCVCVCVEGMCLFVCLFPNEGSYSTKMATEDFKSNLINSYNLIPVHRFVDKTKSLSHMWQFNHSKSGLQEPVL